MRKPAAIMFQGTGSDVGKSLIVAGLCRLYTRRGLRVRPFKPQNMSNNAAVTADGGEIGRAQALQARAARVAPSVHMNPVLLKPQSEIGAQIVVQGKVFGAARAAEYQAIKPELMPQVLASFAQLRAAADLVLSITSEPWAVLLMVNVFLLVVGCFLEPIAVISILVPILMPIILQVGIDPVHFGVMMTLNLMIGLLHPPLGMVLFVLSRVAKLSVERTTMAILPFLIPLLAALLAVTLIPELTLWLPKLAGLVK